MGCLGELLMRWIGCSVDAPYKPYILLLTGGFSMECFPLHLATAIAFEYRQRSTIIEHGDHTRPRLSYRFNTT
jgi:hypothetical protein